MNSMDTLNRAIRLILSQQISDEQLISLAGLTNQYIDFTNIVSLVGADDNLTNIEKRMLENINCHCDKIEKGFVKRLSYK